MNAKTPNPMEVVMFAKNNVRPTVAALVINASFFCCVSLYISWYLFNKKITLGTPITTMSGGIRPDNKVILNPKITMVASEAIIPIRITISAKKTT